MDWEDRKRGSSSIAVALVACVSDCSAHDAEQTNSSHASSLYSATNTLAFDADALSVETHPLAAEAGYYATAAPGQQGALTGTDLGSSFVHRDKLWVMFGDSWFRDPLNLANAPDDALGQTLLSDFPDGTSVDTFVATHPARNGEPAWHAAAPTLSVFLSRGPGSGFAPVTFARAGMQLASGIGSVPITAFSNGRDDAAEGVFAIFAGYEHVPCKAGACDSGYECDLELGTSSTELGNPPCVLGATQGCVRGEGYCQDRGSSVYNASSIGGRTQSTVVRHDVAVTTAADPTHFKAQPWVTQRFLNATARTVTDFDPARVDAARNDFLPAKGNALPHCAVFMWGRPYFGGIGKDGRDAQLYFLWAPMPAPDAQSHFEWQPRYFSGVDADGHPQFSEREIDAKPLDLDAATPGDQPREIHDVVAQMSVSWLPSLKQFVMFYGGDAPSSVENALARSDTGSAQRDPLGRVFLRFAEHPWGPWSAPRELFAAGDRDTQAEATGQYAPGGILAHNNCKAADCARYDPTYLLDVGGNDNGVFYGSNIVDAWTSAHDDKTDVYWFLSTWNPYQVVLMKTTLAL